MSLLTLQSAKPNGPIYTLRERRLTKKVGPADCGGSRHLDEARRMLSEIERP